MIYKRIHVVRCDDDPIRGLCADTADILHGDYGEQERDILAATIKRLTRSDVTIHPQEDFAHYFANN